jgi:hypothetical protein
MAALHNEQHLERLHVDAYAYVFEDGIRQCDAVFLGFNLATKLRYNELLEALYVLLLRSHWGAKLIIKIVKT